MLYFEILLNFHLTCALLLFRFHIAGDGPFLMLSLCASTLQVLGGYSGSTLPL